MTTTAPQNAYGQQRELGRTAISRLYRGQTHFDFINRWKLWFALSGLVIVIGLAALGVRGLNFSIDFKGGVQWEVPTTLSVPAVKSDLGPLYGQLKNPTVITSTNRQTGQVDVEIEASATLTSDKALVDGVTTKLAAMAHVPQDQVVVNAIGPSWGSTITSKAIEAVVVFLVLISLCIAAYFETKMAIGALVALVHDMLVTVGIYALSGFQVSPDTVIAFLTVLGYSLYDTIVVFDKVKENTRGLASTNRFTYTDVVNVSMNQVLARSLNTSFVAVMPVFCILVIGSWIMGASALNDFGLALFIGLMSGAYSSIFIASPILALLKEREPRYSEIRRKLAQYPQARQYLTPSTVAGGHLIARGATPSGPRSPAVAPDGQFTNGAEGPFVFPDEEPAPSGRLAGSVPGRGARSGATGSGATGSGASAPGANGRAVPQSRSAVPPRPGGAKRSGPQPRKKTPRRP